MLAAIWLGLWFAERLSRPVGQLAGAAQRVGQGDLDVRVPEERSDDEIAMLGRLFNQMTRQFKGQRDALIEQNDADRDAAAAVRQRAVLVTAGVIGLNEAGRVDFIETGPRSACCNWSNSANSGLSLQACVPEFASLFERASENPPPRRCRKRSS